MRRALINPRCLAGLLCAFAVIAGSIPLWGDELGGWYASDSRAGVYASARPELQSIYAEGSRLHIPLGLLTEKLREGASKGVSQERIVSCLRSELGRLERAERVLQAAAAPRTLKGDLDDEVPLKAVGIYLRAGIPESVIGGVLSAGSRARRGEEAALSACDAILELRAKASIDDDDSLQIGKLLIASSMQSYAFLTPVFATAKTRGLSDEIIIKDVIIATLAAGGGSDAMNERIAKAQAPQPSVSADPLAVEAGLPYPSGSHSVDKPAPTASVAAPAGSRQGSAHSSTAVAAPAMSVGRGRNPSNGIGPGGPASQGAGVPSSGIPAAASAAGPGGRQTGPSTPKSAP